MSRLLICLLALAFAVIAQHPDPARWRSYSGYGNNIANPTWGSAGNRLRRQGPAVYGDGISSERLTKAKTALPSARLVSNIVHPAPVDGKQPQNIRGLTDYLTYWGQFMDHDLDLTGGPKGSAIPLEPVNIPVPSGDPFFDPNGTGNKSITIYRSVYDPATSKPGVPREQITLVSSYMDGSQIYGSDNDTASSLRTFSAGLMKTTILNGLELPPLNTDGITNANDAHVVNDTQLYLLGDVRGNENPALTALHTLFLREHNRRARQLATWYPSWTDEELYQEARRYVIALLQHITYTEYLPLTVGDGPLAFGGPYPGYNASIDATVATEFSTGAFRYGHSEVAEFIWRVDATGKEIPEGHLRLKNSYFNSPTTIAQVGIEPILRGLAQFTQNAVDIYFIDDLRNYLFGQPGQGGFDLAAVNIQRSRDHGLPGFNDFRAYYGLAPYKNWNEINPDPVVYNALSKAYASIDDCDVYVCGLAEFHDYANVGETFLNSIIEQYLRFRDGDRFWYDQPSQWNDTELAEIKATTLSDVIVRNTPILRTEIQCFVFAQGDGCAKAVAVPPPTVYTKYDYNITLVKKTKAHPFYGLGHAYGFAVNGVEGAVIEVQRGKVYHFNAQISCAHSFFITLVPEIGEVLPNGIPAPNYGVGGDGDAFNQVTGNLGCIQMNRDLEFNCDREIPDWLYYNCDFHDYMGGVIKVTGTVPKPASDATMATYQPIFLLFVIALALLF